MARPKEDLSRVTINQLENLTGSHYRAIVQILSDAGIEEVAADGNARYFETKSALDAIFRDKFGLTEYDENGKKQPKYLDEKSENLADPVVQHARLSKYRADKIKIEIDMLMRRLVPAEDVEKVWTDMIMASKAKMRSLATRIAPSLLNQTDVIKIEEKLEREIDDAMKELKDYEPEQYYEVSSNGDGQMDSAA